MKRKTLVLLALITSLTGWADAVEIDGLYYELVQKTKEAEVVKSPNKYTGNIIIPDSIMFEDIYYNVVTIGYHAFEYCYELESVTIPSSVKTINNYAFNWCGLKEVKLTEGLTTIGDGAFSSCGYIEKIKLPQGLTSIGTSAFSDCQNMREINIPNSVTSLGSYVFDGCWKLESIDIPNNITRIPSGAFSKCKSLKSVIIPSCVISMGLYAFGECPNLTAVYITDLEAWCKIDFNDGTSNPLYNGGYLYLNNEKITDLVIPSSVEEIKANAFTGSNIESLTVPNSVLEIRERAFSGCDKLKMITLGNKINIIGQKAFAYCKDLSDFYSYAPEPPTTYPFSDTFEGSYIDYSTLHVPSASVLKYRDVAPWNGFKEIVAIEGETPPTPKCETPTISYEKGEIKFSCNTDGVEFVTKITNDDIKEYNVDRIALTATYNISVYAKKSGYDNSDVVTATLCWIDAEPKTEGITNGVANIRANPVLIQSDGNVLSISGVDAGTPISVFDVSGKQVGSATATSESTSINTNLTKGQIGIVKIGEKTIKIVVR